MNSLNPQTGNQEERPTSVSPDTQRWMTFVRTNVPSGNLASNAPSVPTSESEPDSISESSPSVSEDEYCPSAVPDPVVYVPSDAPPTSDEEADGQRYIGRFLVLGLLGPPVLRIL